ncbi:MAG: methyltransferase, partial [Buchnera aphidicola]|nr:methyltransferase [Buchnera aphidicola]
IIISNPPIHEDLHINFNILKKIIKNSINCLKKNGELRLVTNYCVNCENILKKYFKTFNVLKTTKKYKIYQAFLN